MKEKTFSTIDVAKLLDVYSSTIARWVDEGKIKAYVTPGGHRKIRREDLIEFLEKYNMPIPKEIELSEKYKILVVEDEVEIQKMIIRILKPKSDKYEIITANDGFQAGHALTTYNPDLVILDLMLPGINGFEICRLIKKVRPETKILAISGYSTEENKKKILDAGANEFMSKPFEIDELLSKVTDILGDA